MDEGLNIIELMEILKHIFTAYLVSELEGTERSQFPTFPHNFEN